VQTKCVEAPSGERAWKNGREVSDDVVTKITAHIASLPVPARRGSDARGKKIFGLVGCSTCHVPSLPLTGGGSVAAFTDLLLHDMGKGLADGIVEGSATGSEWRTAPLMGLGRLMENNMPLLHDGRARDAEEAILWHGGEAAGVVHAYSMLSGSERRALIRFLETL
jgi:CxxC motif-containing protein (DUF1111 family)